MEQTWFVVSLMSRSGKKPTTRSDTQRPLCSAETLNPSCGWVALTDVPRQGHHVGAAPGQFRMSARIA